jgi:L-fuconolactonase
MRIDAHQHYWHPARGDYPWMAGAPAILQQPYGPQDLAPLRAACGIEATVLVQAAPTVEETQYLLGVAEVTSSVAGVIGWIDFRHASERRTLDDLAAHRKLVGVRPMVQDIADDDWLLRRDIDWAFAALQELDLAFDALGYARHARRFLQRIERHPQLRVVIDHGMKPAIARGEFEPWAGDIRDLARNTSAMCKVSGLASEAAPGSGVEVLRPYMEHLLEVFGPERLMWGSDWPVASAAIGYVDWFRACEQLLLPCGDGERERVFGANAAAFYQLSVQQ